MGRFGALLAVVVAAGCQQAAGTRDDLSGRSVRVAATTGMIADLARNVGGGRVEVDALMGPGVDPHQYRATEGDLGRLRRADLILYNGLHLEGKMADVFEELGKRRRVVAVTRDLSAGELRPAAEGFEGAHDPHVWFDVSLWSKAAGTVAAALAEADPAHAADYQARLAAYQKELADLHAEVKRKADSLPRERRVLVTAHDAFYYFGHAYGFEVRGLQGISTAAEATARDVDGLARFIGERKLPAIFNESSVPDRNVSAVIAAVRSGWKVEVKLGGLLYSDALGEPGTPARTYAGMVRHNIDTIVAALGGG